MVKAIVMDMDGTLLDANDCISEHTKKALISLEEKGIKLILASGRNYRRLKGIANELKMDQYKGYFIEIDGIAYSDLNEDKRYILHQMDKNEISSLFHFLKKFHCEIQACCENTLYSYIPKELYPIKEKERKERMLSSDFPWTGGPWTWNFDMRKAYGNVIYIQNEDEIKDKINKLQIMDKDETIQKIFNELNNNFKGQFEFFRTSHRQIEILPYGYSKGFTLQKIMKINHWTKQDVIAFGDGENDVSLFAQVENSFAMGQAEEYVKEKAKYITSSNNEEGIYKALKKLKLI